MSQLHAKVTLKDGRVMIAEFEKLKGIRGLAADITSGRRALPLWRKVSEEHPTSGEPVVLRTRTFVSGDQVAEMEVVHPKRGMEDTHEYNPDNFEAAPLMKSLDRFGLWTAPAGDAAVVGVEAGTEYPIHRDADHRRYVIVRWHSDEAQQVRHYLDGARPGQSTEHSFEEDEDEDESGWNDDDDI